MTTPSFFLGSALKFAVAGEGVSFDPATGEIRVTTAALTAGVTVTVTPVDDQGVPGAPFRLTVAAAPGAGDDVAPSLLTPPTLEGRGRIGAALVVASGSWGGVPAPSIALQWLRGGVEIADATGTSYVPQADDDGQEITVRVTASNGAGALVAVPEAVVAIFSPPVALGGLADVTATESDATMAVDAAAAFAGEGLRFAATGAGATVDAVTGRVSIPTGILLAGETVTVTATNSGGAAEASFRVTVAAKPLPLPPVLLAAPVLAGAGKVGSPLTVESGSWSGTPALALQWLRDGAEIAGATGTRYVPVDADDRATLAVRVAALNAGGELTAVTAGIAVTQVAPEVVGELFDEVFDREDGSVPVETAQVFSGRALGYSVSGGGATIDAATGVLSIPTGAARSGEAVTVTATNSGGAAQASFLLTIEDPDAFPLPLADDAWTAGEVRDVAPAGRRRIEVAGSVVVPEGFELRLYSGPQAGGVQDLTNRIMTPGVVYTTVGSMATGSTCYGLLFWRRIEDGAWAPASREVALQMVGLVDASTPPVAGSGGSYAALPPANVVSAASWSAVDAQIAARIASGAAGTYIIDLPNGSYGAPIVNRAAADNQSIVIRSQNKNVGGHIGGAKFEAIGFGTSRGIFFEFVDVDRTALGYVTRIVDFRNSTRCGLSYSRVRSGIVRPVGGWSYDANGGVLGKNVNYHIDVSTSTGTIVLGNAIYGFGDGGIYGAGFFNSTIEQNVFQQSKADNIKVSWGIGNVIRDNWGARDMHAGFNAAKPADPWDHCDFIQAESLGLNGPLNDYVFAGNVFMLRDYNGRLQANPAQGVFSSSPANANWRMEQNIVVTNSNNGLQIGGLAANNSGHVIRQNTLLRCIDYPDVTTSGAGVGGCYVSAAPSVDVAQSVGNVVTRRIGQAAFGTRGLVIQGNYNAWSAIDAYYTSARRTSTFYALRPVAGQPTHWDYSGGQPLGAAEKFRRTIVDKVGFPKLGAGFAAWKQDYDWNNEIMGAA